MNNFKTTLVVLCLFAVAGCARVIVTPFGGSDDPSKKGVRYYAPQLYLLVTFSLPDIALAPQQSEESITLLKEVPDKKPGDFKVDNKTTTTTKKAAALTREAQPVVKYEFFYLPDYSQGFRAEQKGGFGSSEMSLKLTNGWQLTEFGAKSDSQAAATIEAASAALGVVLAFDGIAPKAGLYKVNLRGKITFERVEAFPEH